MRLIRHFGMRGRSIRSNTIQFLLRLHLFFTILIIIAIFYVLRFIILVSLIVLNFDFRPINWTAIAVAL